VIQIRAAQSVELVPVLEVEPYKYSDRPVPDESPARLHRAVWDAYFQQCMTDAGLGALRTIRPGSFFVRVEQMVGTAALDRMLRDAHGDDGTAALPGGYALVVDGAVTLEPECCGDLGNLASWEAALASQPAEAEIWIGHPQPRIAFDGERVTLRQGWETSPEPDDLVEVAMSVDQLREAIAGARVAVTAFHRALEAEAARVLDSIEPVPELVGGLA